ncbi:hypothetical protein C8R47DRAFT_1315482 [Mycena vitilis]|nr:hypothetical protein C8R47DRAFT_1315482 [Mycena vitilis]
MTHYLTGPPANLTVLPRGHFASYQEVQEYPQWLTQSVYCPRLYQIVANIRMATTTVNPQIRRHYYFIATQRHLTSSEQANAQFMQPVEGRTYQFFANFFPRICLHDNLEAGPLGIGERPMIGYHDRGTHNSIIFLDTAAVRGLEDAQGTETIRSLTILLVATLYHELAHSFWTAANGVTLTPPALNWNAGPVSAGAIAGESGFVVEGSLLGCEIWPLMDGEIADTTQLVWVSPGVAAVSYILTERKIKDIYDYFMQFGHLGIAPLFSIDDIEEAILRVNPTPQEVVIEYLLTARGRQSRYRYRLNAYAGRTCKYRVNAAFWDRKSEYLAKRSQTAMIL